MEIFKGIQVNCSELLIRLPNAKRNEILKELESIGLDEVIIKNRWKYLQNNEVSQWDNETNTSKLRKVKDLGKEFYKLYDKVHKERGEKDIDEDEMILRNKYDFDILNDTIELVEMKKGEDAIYGANVNLGEYPDDSSALAIWYHQHCQSQGFPLLKKISEHFWAEVEPYDGGSIDDYETWLDREELDENEEE